MSEMVERVATAIRGVNETTAGLTFRELSEAMARAAIEAMREPICAAIHCGCSNHCDFDEAEETIRDLIDAALRE